MRKSSIYDIVGLVFVFLPLVIGLALNTHPAGTGPFGCFIQEPSAAPKPAWQIEQDREDASIRAKLHMDYREAEQ